MHIMSSYRFKTREFMLSIMRVHLLNEWKLYISSQITPTWKLTKIPNSVVITTNQLLPLILFSTLNTANDRVNKTMNTRHAKSILE